MKTNPRTLAAAIADFERALPGWWWSVGSCQLSRDASCGPELDGPDGKLCAFAQFREGFHCDATGTIAQSLKNVMRQALRAKATHAQEHRTPKIRKIIA